MYYDITHNIEVNKKLIKLIGLTCATYWAELACILRKVYEKNTYDAETKFFKLNRRYIEDQIGLTLEEQYQCDTVLMKLGAMIQDESDQTRSTIKISMPKIVSLIVEDNPEHMQQIAKSIKVTTEDKANAKRLSKAVTAEERQAAKDMKKQGLIQGRINQAKKILGHAEFDDLYDSWIRMVYEGGKFVRDDDIENFHRTIWDFTQDTKTYREVMEIAITNHWINADWAITSYKKDHKFANAGGAHIAATQKIATSMADVCDLEDFS